MRHVHGEGILVLITGGELHPHPRVPAAQVRVRGVMPVIVLPRELFPERYVLLTCSSPSASQGSP